MPKFRKKPIVIEAWQMSASMAAMPGWLGSSIELNKVRVRDDTRHLGEMKRYLLIDTLEGTVRADIGDWIIQGVKGEIYPCKPDIFDATYEAVAE